MKRKQYIYRVNKNGRYWMLYNLSMMRDWHAWKEFEKSNWHWRDFKVKHTQYFHDRYQCRESIVSLRMTVKMSRPERRRFAESMNKNNIEKVPLRPCSIWPQIPKVPRRGRKDLFKAIIKMDIFADGCDDLIYEYVMDRLENLIKTFMLGERRASRKDWSLHEWATKHRLLNAYNLGV